MANYVYAAGYTTQKVFQYDPADMSKVAESLSYGDIIRALTTILITLTEKTSFDSGSGTDSTKANNPCVYFSTTESGHGVDTSTGNRGFVILETGSGLDALFQLLAILPIKSDSGIGSETPHLLAEYIKEDSGSGSELARLISQFVSGDSGTGTDNLLTLLISLLVSETGSGIDTVVARFINALDSGVGIGTIVSLLGKTASDSGICSIENSYLHILEGVKKSSDSGSGSDSSALKAQFLQSEIGVGVEAVISRFIYTRELPTGAIDLAKLITATLTGQDVGSGAETSLARVVIQSSETGSGSELATLTGLFTSSDSGVGADVLTLLAAMIANDAGVGVEEAISFSRNLIDTGNGAETLALVANVLKSSDVGAGLETICEVTRTLIEGGVGTESILGFYRTALETGVGLDTVASFLRKVLDSGVSTETVQLVGLVGRAMRLINYMKSYSDVRTYTRKHSDLKTYVREVQQ